MTTHLTDDLRQALEQPGGTPIYVVDMVKSLFEEDEFDPRELYPHVERSLLRAGWDDSDLDIYNEAPRNDDKGGESGTD